MTHGFRVSCAALTVLLCLFVAGTLCNVFLVSPAALGHALSDGSVGPVLRVSLETSMLAALFAILLGTPVAYVLSSKRFVGKSVVETLLDST